MAARCSLLVLPGQPNTSSTRLAPASFTSSSSRPSCSGVDALSTCDKKGAAGGQRWVGGFWREELDLDSGRPEEAGLASVHCEPTEAPQLAQWRPQYDAGGLVAKLPTRHHRKQLARIDSRQTKTRRCCCGIG